MALCVPKRNFRFFSCFRYDGQYMRLAEKHHIGRIPASSRLAAAGWPVLLFLICVGMFWKLVLTNQFTWLEGPDTANQVLPWFQYQAGEWHQGRFPLWDPHHWGGQSLIGQAQPGTAYPLNWLLLLMPLHDGWMAQWALHWYYVLIHFQAALFCYWLCRDLGRSPAASVFAGSIFAFSGFVGTTDWPQMLNGAVWAPAVFLFFLRMLRGERPLLNAAWSGACLGIAFLSGHHQIPVFISLALGGAWLYYLFEEGRPDRKRIQNLLVFGLFVVLLGAFQMFPAYEYGKTALRWVGARDAITWNQAVPYSVHQEFSLSLYSLLGIVLPGLHRHANPFMGFTAVILALLAIRLAWQERMVRFFATIALGGILLSLGGNSILHGLAYALVPMVEKARSPSMAILIFNFGLAVLTAYGIDYLLVSKERWTTPLLLGVGGALLVLFGVFYLTHAAFGERLGIVAFTALALAGLLYLIHSKQISSRSGIALLLVLSCVELSTVVGYGFPQKDDQPDGLLQKLAKHSDIAQFLSRQPQPIRVDIDDQLIPYNFGDWYGIEQFGGYLASMSNNVARALASRRTKWMYGTNYFVGKEPRGPGQIEVFTSRTGLKVYRDPAAYPRAWVVHKAIMLAPREDGIAKMNDAAFDPHTSVILAGSNPELQVCSGADSATIMERNAGYVSLLVNLPCRGMVILGDTYGPGWTATVDGQTTRVAEAYTFLRGVAVDVGRHRVELRYRPKSVYLGVALTGLGALAAIALHFIV
jgi:Bacterial membrane protein YfhO